MSEAAAIATKKRKAPWHLWVVGVIALLWYVSGAYTIAMAQAGRLPDLSADETAYYAAQPLWFVLLTDVALFSAVAGAVALLLRYRAAVWLFAISLAAIVITNTYDLVAGSSRALANNGAMIVTALIAVIAVLVLVYARAMKKSGVLK